MTKFLSTSGIDRTLPDEFENEDWKEYLKAKYREESDRIIAEISLTPNPERVQSIQGSEGSPKAFGSQDS